MDFTLRLILAILPFLEKPFSTSASVNTASTEEQHLVIVSESEPDVHLIFAMSVLDALGIRRNFLMRSTVDDQLARAHERHQCCGERSGERTEP